MDEVEENSTDIDSVGLELTDAVTTMILSTGTH